MKKTNHIAILIDRSSSTSRIAPGIIAQCNQQIALMRDRSNQEGQETHVSLYTFSNEADRPLFFEVPLGLVDIKPLTSASYEVNGMTAMFDSVGMAVEDLQLFHRDLRSGDHSFLIMVLTDGQENQSTKYDKHKLNHLMSEKIRTDVWSFVFLVPRGDKRGLVEKFGIHEGNVAEWDQTARGVEDFGKATSAGLNAYFSGRTKGLRATKAFFSTDLSKVSAREIQSSLTEVTSWYEKYEIKKKDCDGTDQHGNDTVVIEKFCAVHFGQYVIGNAFYELQKREKVQDRKMFIVEDMKTGRMYGGDEARTLLGFPPVGEVSVVPGNHGQFRIYVQSTSVNRKLLKGTCVLYKRR